MNQCTSFRNALVVFAAALLAGVSALTAAQGWKPERPIELIVGCAPAQVAYWESVFQRFLDTPEWAAEMATRYGMPKFTGAYPPPATTRSPAAAAAAALSAFWKSASAKP